VGGTATCKPDGSGYGVCLGEVTPQPEDCTTTEDRDCNGLLCGQAAVAGMFPVDPPSSGVAVASDAQGNIYLAGSFSGSLNFGSTSSTWMPSAGGQDIYLAKLDPKGMRLWSMRFGSAGDDVVAGMRVDAAGNIVMVGSSANGADFGGGNIGATGFYLVEFDGTGTRLWNNAYVLSGGAGVADLAVDSAGNVVVVGSYHQMDLGDGMVGTPATQGSGFIAKLSSNGGKLLWKKTFASATPSRVSTVAVDPSDDSVLADGTKYDATGNVTWTLTFSGNGFFSPGGLAVDPGGSPLLFGSVNQSVSIGGTTFAADSDGNDAAFLKFTSKGTLISGKVFVDTGSETVERVAVDSAKNVTLYGAFNGGIDFGGGMLQSAGMDDLFLAKLDPTGAHVWSKRFGDPGMQSAGGVAIDPDGAVLITGTAHGGTIDFGTGKLSAGLGDAIFFAKIPKP
jgi:hypothetical protein